MAALWMLDHQNDRLRCTGFSAARPAEVKRLERRTRAVWLAEGDGIPGRAWRSRVPIVTDDPVDDPRWEDLDPEDALAASLAFPLVAEGRVIGVIELLSDAHASVPAPVQRALAVLGNELGAGLERHLAMEAAGTERARLEAALAAGQMGVWDWDVKSNRVRWSATLEAMSGLKAGSFGGSVEDFVGLVHADDRDWVLEQFAHALDPTSDRIVDVEYRSVVPEGGTRWFHVVGRSVFDAAGVLTAMTGVAVDVTDRVRREEAARMDAEHLRIALDTAGLGGWRFYWESQVGWWSESLVELLGQGPDGGGTVTLEDILESIHPDDRGVVDDIMAAASEQRDFHAVYRVVRSGGAVVTVESRGRPLHDAAGELIGLAGVTAVVDEAEDGPAPR